MRPNFNILKFLKTWHQSVSSLSYSTLTPSTNILPTNCLDLNQPCNRDRKSSPPPLSSRAGDTILISRPSTAGKQAYRPLDSPVEVDLGSWNAQHWRQYSMKDGLNVSRSQSFDEGELLQSPTSSGEFYDPSYSVWPGEIIRTAQGGRPPPRTIKPGSCPNSYPCLYE